MQFLTAFTCLTAILSSTFVDAAPARQDVSDVTPQVPCTYDSARNPGCWGKYSINTNWYEDGPDTGRVREYWFEMVNKTLAPDGVERIVLTVNGTIPGPTITADWGDTIVVHVINGFKDNGTSIHYHGLRQFETNQADGVASITQCPLAPGDSATYTFKATQYGTSWWHSHFDMQAYNGVFGPIVINGPASAPYDVDTGPVVLTDWYHNTSDQLLATASSSAPPTPENGLINGLNVFNGGGERWKTSFTAGKTYRLRVINTALDTLFKFGIDNHTLTVIAVDLVPVKPYTTTYISVAIAQRVDVVVTADQAPNNYYLRAIPQISCSSNLNVLNIAGIVTYKGVSVEEPTTTLAPYVDSCFDEPLASMTPIVALDAEDSEYLDLVEVGLATDAGFFKWTINDVNFVSQWNNPTLQKVIAGNSTFAPEENVVFVNETNAWTYLVIESAVGVDHPIHLHGHDFYALAQEGSATYTGTDQLNLVNPPRRDVIMLPAGGFVAIAFKNDNPGVWLVHCHIGWHTAQGLALQIVERESQISKITDTDQVDSVCDAWDKYQTATGLVQTDAGI